MAGRSIGPRVLVVGILAVVGAGCGTAALPGRFPSRPPAGMRPEAAAQDVRACQDIAARATTDRSWQYIGCLVSRGHQAPVPFTVYGWRTLFDVTQTRPRSAEVAVAELKDCQRVSLAGARSGGRKTREQVADELEVALRTCAEPRGYAVQRAEPLFR